MGISKLSQLITCPTCENLFAVWRPRCPNCGATADAGERRSLLQPVTTRDKPAARPKPVVRAAPIDPPDKPVAPMPPRSFSVNNVTRTVLDLLKGKKS